jgi:hypothetical protein
MASTIPALEQICPLSSLDFPIVQAHGKSAGERMEQSVKTPVA